MTEMAKLKLTKEVIDTICKGIRHGLTYKDAAQLAHVSESTFYVWKTKAEKAKSGIFLEFLESLKRANVEAKGYHLSIINKIAGGGIEVEELRIAEKKCGKCGEEITETVTTTKKTLPVWQASAWVLERRFPDEFGRFIQPSQGADEDDPFQKWIDDLNEAERQYGHMPLEK